MKAVEAGVIGIIILISFWLINKEKPPKQPPATSFVASSHIVWPEISETQMLRAIIGEASDQPYLGQVAVSCAILNRGSLNGVYGVFSKHIDKEPLETWNTAKKALKESLGLFKEGYCHEYGDSWRTIDGAGAIWTHPIIYMQTIGNHAFYWRLKTNN